MSGQNTSSAVMQQRAKALDAFDDFPTPPWATRVLCEYLDDDMGASLANWLVEEPCANRGYMTKGLKYRCHRLIASDIFDYGVGFEVKDYLFEPAIPSVDWTISNPPFKLAERIIHLGLARSRRGVAMFLRSPFEEGIGRYKRLFSHNPPSRKLIFSERVVIHKGKMLDPDVQIWDPKLKNGKGGFKKPSSATAYCWMIWDKKRIVGVDQERMESDFTGECRKRLTHPGDYDVLGSVVA